MDLSHAFTVPASIEVTWAAFQDIESVAGCFPGATVTSVDGDDFKGSCKVKLGPISLVYAGSGTFVEKDADAHRFVIEAKGRDKRGNGTAGATVTASLVAEGPDATHVEVLTDLAITGKPAQFGRGLMQEVSDKLLGQFVDCLKDKVGAPVEAAPAAAPAAAAEPAGTPEKAPAEEPAPVASAPAPPRETAAALTPEPPADDALDLGATLIPVLLKSYWKPLVGLLVALLVLRRLLRR